MKAISKGNVQIGAAGKGWFIGHFMTNDPYRQTGDMEAKWGVHRVSEKEKPFEGNYKGTSMSVLISGRFRFEFRQEGQIEAVALEEAGDYVVWLPKVDHRGSATVDNTVMLTLRWPSIKGDHYECPL